jgi:putative pyruvate formate lyase activating enzyme
LHHKLAPESCELCPRRCLGRRRSGASGACGADDRVLVAAATIHRGEEPPISGERGSATFFFSNCPLACRFCQNFPISQLGYGTEVDVPWLAHRMLQLERRGAHNVNLVTGTQYTPWIVAAVRAAREQGLSIPVAWNTSGFERQETIDSLAGTVDIYLADIKYGDDAAARELSNAPDYFATATRAAQRMVEQVGPLVTGDDGMAIRGVIVRHLVLPGGLAGTGQVMRFVVERLGPQVPVSLMCQYFPAHRAHGHPLLGRGLGDDEYRAAIRAAREAGVERGWFQDPGATGGA